MIKNGSTKEQDVRHTAAGESYYFISGFTLYLVEKEDDSGKQTHGIRYGNRLL
jgi:hypothetical protein